MKITKLEHACLDITDTDGRLVIDPGRFTSPLADYSGITALVVTHVHGDHLDETKVQKILEANPRLQVFCTQEVADTLGEEQRITVPSLGTDYQAGPFKLEFFGGQHAIILDDYPHNQNFGVLVNDTIYYPGDSLTACSKPHKVLAVPSVAPWLKLSEAAAFIKQDNATQIFPTHNGIVNDIGNNMINTMLSGVADQSGKKYIALAPGESIEI